MAMPAINGSLSVAPQIASLALNIHQTLTGPTLNSSSSQPALRCVQNIKAADLLLLSRGDNYCDPQTKT